MTCLRNAWYAAGWEDDLLPATATRIRIMNEWVAIYRDAAGRLNALSDVCPHRFAALGTGKVVDGALQCPYHGLRFDGTGRCVHNPHGDGSIAANAAVRGYPVVGRHGAIWLWMGEHDQADPATIPDFSLFAAPGQVTAHGYLHIDAHYQLVTDNLLDLSHAEFVHPFLATPGSAERSRIDVTQSDRQVSAYLWVDDQEITPLFRLVWDDPATHGLLHSHMHWFAPSSHYLDVGMSPLGKREDEGVNLPSAHLITPETDGSCHYFWAVTRNVRTEDEQLTKTIAGGIASAFETEDRPVIEQAFAHMAGRDFWAMKPLILAGDNAGIRARRLLQKLIRHEQVEAAEQPAAE